MPPVPARGWAPLLPSSICCEQGSRLCQRASPTRARSLCQNPLWSTPSRVKPECSLGLKDIRSAALVYLLSYRKPSVAQLKLPLLPSSIRCEQGSRLSQREAAILIPTSKSRCGATTPHLLKADQERTDLPPRKRWFEKRTTRQTRLACLRRRRPPRTPRQRRTSRECRSTTRRTTRGRSDCKKTPEQTPEQWPGGGEAAATENQLKKLDYL